MLTLASRAPSSSYQPEAPNFRVDGRSFAITKATESTTYFDPHFNANRAAAAKNSAAALKPTPASV